MVLTPKNGALFLSGAFGLILPAIFAWQIYQTGESQNLAAWSMILLIDVLAVVLAYKAGNKKPYLQMGWTIAALGIVTAILSTQKFFIWTWVETVSMALCAIAIILWLTLDAEKALWAYIAAAWCSAAPIIADFWRAPQVWTLYLWIGTIVACALAIYGAEKRTFATTSVAWSALICNALITVLCLR